jgi:hypothetical protein
MGILISSLNPKFYLDWPLVKKNLNPNTSEAPMFLKKKTLPLIVGSGFKNKKKTLHEDPSQKN